MQLWVERDDNQPLTRDCTLITNGQNLLQVYLDGVRVYFNEVMNLGYQYPLSARMEVQTTDGSMMRYARFWDFYATTSNNVTVSQVPTGFTVQLASPSGKVYASATAGASGTASLNVGAYTLPIAAALVVITEEGSTPCQDLRRWPDLGRRRLRPLISSRLVSAQR